MCVCVCVCVCGEGGLNNNAISVKDCLPYLFHGFRNKYWVLLKTEKDFCHRKGAKRTFGHRKGLRYGMLCYKNYVK